MRESSEGGAPGGGGGGTSRAGTGEPAASARPCRALVSTSVPGRSPQQGKAHRPAAGRVGRALDGAPCAAGSSQRAGPRHKAPGAPARAWLHGSTARAQLASLCAPFSEPTGVQTPLCTARGAWGQPTAFALHEGGDLLWPVGTLGRTEQLCDQAGAHREMGGGGSVEPKLVVAGLQHVLAAWEALHHHLSGSSAPLPVPGFEDATWSALGSLGAPGVVLCPSNAVASLDVSLSPPADTLSPLQPHRPLAAQRRRCLLPSPPAPQPFVCVVAQGQPARRGSPAARLHRHTGAPAAAHRPA